MIRRFSRVYRVLPQAARVEGIEPGRLSDFLELEYGGELVLLGQEELDISVLDRSCATSYPAMAVTRCGPCLRVNGSCWPPRESATTPSPCRCCELRGPLHVLRAARTHMTRQDLGRPIRSGVRGRRRRAA